VKREKSAQQARSRKSGRSDRPTDGDRDTSTPDAGKDESDLFRRAVGDVRPLRITPRAPVERPRLKPRPRQRERDERAVLDELLAPFPLEHGLETGEELLFLREGYQHRFLQRLRRGRYSIGDEIDLHGMNEAAARDALLWFLQRATDRGLGCVRVVHGKGLRSRGKPKLKTLANRLLRRHPAVVAFASCRPEDGGTGAVLVLLRRGGG
jgi:DNA-nicking Smr family endonuclease